VTQKQKGAVWGMTQREFNQLLAFQPNAEPGESIRGIIHAWFESEYGEPEGEKLAKIYLEEIRKAHVS
jgi:hypothetical protein